MNQDKCANEECKGLRKDQDQYCQKCLEKFNSRKGKYVDQPTECSVSSCRRPPIPGKKRCQGCTDTGRKTRERRKSVPNICARCYSHPRASNSTSCAGCLEKCKAYQKTEAGKEAKKRDKIRSRRPSKRRERTLKQNQYARKAGLEGQVSTAEIEKLLKDAQGLCFYCGESAGQYPHRDHVIPRGKPIRGPHFIWNLRVACERCNCKVKKQILSPSQLAIVCSAEEAVQWLSTENGKRILGLYVKKCGLEEVKQAIPESLQKTLIP